MPLLQGDTVDRYVIDAFLGAGGMGEVYRARDTRLERSVALKIVRPGGEGSMGSGRPSIGAARTLREARAAAALEHPNVVSIYDVGQVDAPGPLQGTMYIAMELLKGESLRAYVGDARVAMDERVRWLTDVARALAAAHRAGIVHRDIKPENVMVRHDGIVKVLDFGIAKRSVPVPVDPASATELATTAGVLLGTPMYMAPEQLRGEALDARADQFAWGVLAYELLTGKPPWSREGGPFVVASQILSDAPVSLDPPADVPPLVAAAVTRALRKDAARRFDSMDDVVDALTGVFARRASLPPPAPLPSAQQGTERHSAMELPSSRRARSGEARQTPPADPPEAPPAPHASAPPVAAAGPSRSSRVARITALALAAAAVAAFGTLALRGPSTARPAGTSAPTAPRAPACTGHRACVEAHGGAPWICRASDGACVAIASEDCTAHYEPEDLASDDTVWFGAMLPLTGPRAEAFGKMDANVLELARLDFAGVGGILGAADGTMRRVGLVVCDATPDARRAAAHLADLDVAAVLGPAVGLKDALDVVTNVLLPKRQLVLDLFDESPLVTRVPQPSDVPRLVWRLTSSAEQGGEALAHVVSDHVEPLLRRADGALAGGRPMKLAVVRSDAPTPAAILEAFASKVVLNGKPLVDSGELFQQHTFRRGELTAADREKIVRELTALAPHVIVYAESEVFEDAFVEALERSWKAAYRPIYVSEGVLANPKLHAIVGASVEKRRRFLSVDLPANTDENFKFVLHYNEAFEPKITPGTAPGVIYDAFYVAAYAAAATGKARVTGVEMARAMARLGGDGARVPVGPSHIFEGYAVLRQGKSLRLTGAGTQLDLDHEAGELPTDFAVYCMGVDRDGRATAPVESGLRFDHRAKRLEGTLRCP